MVQKLHHPCILGRDVLTVTPIRCEIASQDGKLSLSGRQADVVMIRNEPGVAPWLREIERANPSTLRSCHLGCD